MNVAPSIGAGVLPCPTCHALFCAPEKRPCTPKDTILTLGFSGASPTSAESEIHSLEIYGDWSDDPAKLETTIQYMLL